MVSSDSMTIKSGINLKLKKLHKTTGNNNNDETEKTEGYTG